MKATSAIGREVLDAGKGEAGRRHQAAPAISSVRRSWRGAIQPMTSVSSAVPSSDAVATMPTATAS